MEFIEYPKTPRLNRNCVVTEKIDGTNACVAIDDSGNIYAGSRNRWITPEADNFGFARWVQDHKEELLKLGPGRHYGEWWGAGIQRRYGLTEKKFSLFNVARWCVHGTIPLLISNVNPKAPLKYQEVLPHCCSLVPILWSGIFHTAAVNAAVESLRHNGSVASPGFMKPEGVVVYHEAARQVFKVLLENDQGSKGE